MITIPVIPPIQEDELLYGYLMRLQKANEFPFMRPFINTFIAPDSTASERLRRLPEYSLLRDFENICCVTNRESKKKEIFLNSGLFPFYRLFLTSEQQAVIINRAFTNNSNDSLFEVSSVKMVSKIRYCQECRQEDSPGWGSSFYLHRSHQLPGVVRCPKHGCLLETYSGPELHEMDETAKTVTEKPFEGDLEHAEYCKQLLDHAIDADSAQLKRAVVSKLKTNYSDNRKAAYDNFSRNAKIKLSPTTFTKIWNAVHSEEYLNIVPTIAFLSWIFPDVAVLKAEIGETEAPAVFSTMLNKRNCSLLEPYSRTLVTIKHDCGAIFCIHPNEFIDNWECPICGNSNYSAPKISAVSRNEETFRQEIADLTGEEYSLDGPYIDIKHKVKIKHNACGHSQEYKPSNFLDGFRCSNCAEVLDMERYGQIVQSLSDGRYQILAKRKNDLCTVKDMKTGRLVDVPPRKAVAELKRPTPSILFPTDKKAQKAVYEKTKIDKFQIWLESVYCRGEPIFLDEINPEDVKPTPLSYKRLKRYIHELAVKEILSNPAPGVYFYSDESFTAEETAWFRYICSRGRHIGYPTGENALFYLGLLPDRPDSIRLATNKETSNNKTGRTTKFMGKKLRIKGSPFNITDENWQVLMILKLYVNLEKYMKGQATDSAKQTIATFVHKNGLTREAFSIYQNKYRFSETFVRDLFRRVEEME